MEVLFQNTYIRNRNMLKEVYANVLFFKSYAIFLDAFMLLAFLISIFQIFLLWDFSFHVQICTIVYIIVRLLSYSNTIQTMLKRDAELSKGAPIEVTIQITEGAILTNTSHGHTSELAITSVRFATKTNNYLVLQTEAKHLVVLKKDSFSVGSYEAFLQFLQRKNIKIK